MSVEKSSESSSKAAKHVERERTDEERRRNDRQKSEASEQRRRKSFRETFERAIDREKARGDRRSKAKSASEERRRGRRSEVESSKKRRGRDRQQAGRAEKRRATERSGEPGGRRVGGANERNEREQVDRREREAGSATQQPSGEEGAVGGVSVNDGASGGPGSSTERLAEPSGAVHRHSGAAKTTRSEREQRIESIANEMVRAVRVGRDGQRRRVVMLELEIPGRGGLNVRMRRDGEGYDIRMRAERSALGAELKRGTSKMKGAMEERGVAVGSINIDEE